MYPIRKPPSYHVKRPAYNCLERKYRHLFEDDAYSVDRLFGYYFRRVVAVMGCSGRTAVTWIFHLALFCFYGRVCAQLSFTISEEADKGTVVGNLAKDLHINVKDLENRQLRILSENFKKHFEVDLKTGALFVSDRIDREQLCPRTEKCTLHVEAMLSNPTNLHRLEVHVTDINDNAPFFREKSHIFNIYESSSTGERYLLPIAHDPDWGINSIQSYKLSPNEYFSLDGGQHSESAELVLQKPLDREKHSVIHLTLTAFDGGKPPLSGSMNIVINVIDTNDNVPIFNKPLYKAQIVENALFDTSVLTVTATDLDEGLNSEIVYSFIERGDFNPTSLFSINPETGLITVVGNIDYEQNPAYDVRVQARDKEVIDVNDNSAEAGTVVALVTVSDKDGGKNGLTTASVLGLAPFKLKLNYKNYYSLIVDGQLDRETISQYNVTIVSTDEGTPPLSSSSLISVQISDVNDNAPQFSEPVLGVYVKENTPIGSTIYTVTVSDLDKEDNAKVTYSLYNLQNAHINSAVNINSETGDVVTLQSFNFEELKTFQFKVQATDSGVPPLSSNVTVNVFILDENDNSPTILAPYSEHGSVNSESIPYSAEAGYFVAKIRAVDADSGYNALLSYHLSEPKGNNLFRIGTSTGEVRTKRRMSDNDLKTHPMVVLVCDNGEPSLSATVSIDVVVVESTADIQTQFRHVPIKEDSFSDLNLYLLIAIVAVSVIFLLSLITLIAVRCHRTESSFSRYSAPMITTHPDGSWSYSKSTQQYDVCFSSDTLKSDVVVFPAPFPPVDAELISINGGDTFTRTQTLPNTDKVYAEGGEVSPPMGAGMDSNSWHFRYGPGGPGAPGAPQLKPGDVPPEAFIIPGSPAIISIRQNQDDEKGDFMSFGKKEEKKRKRRRRRRKIKRTRGKMMGMKTFEQEEALCQSN
uniref:Cadherin domain-containing protein n=1 Tax=Neogobius melanostomus TaxID=47308 RepID=A0A8C6T3I6_9GOBI